jgi:hypothetical protein
MKPPPRLRLEPRPSRIACAAIVAGCTAVSALVASLPLEAPMTVGALLAIAGVAVRGLWRCTGRGVPALLHVGHDRRLTASTRDGRTHDGSILDASYVGARITAIVWRSDRLAWYAPSSTILVLPDTLPSDDFRRLRVLLRYGRPLVEEMDEETSGRAAG